jgi:diacylglycerol kinase (ATP)
MNGWLAIVNSHSGGRNTEDAAMVEGLRHFTTEVVFTEYSGHARELAAAVDDHRAVVAVGGDGTLFEILNGIDRTRHEIAILPAGRGNSLARDLGIATIEDGLDALDHGRTVVIDLAEVALKGSDGFERRVTSASTIAVGYPVAATILASRLKRLGRFCYAAAATISSIEMKPEAMSIAYDDGAPTKTRLNGLIVSNSRHLANFVAFPEADLTDRYLDLMELSAGPLSQNLRNLSALAGIDFCRPAPIRKIRHLRVSLRNHAAIMIDGEIFEDVVEFEATVAPRAIRCRRGASCQ